MSGVAVYINGQTHPPLEELKLLVASNGGRVEHYYSKAVCTHMVAEELPDTKAKELLAERQCVPVVYPSWLLDSIKAGKRLPEREYLLPAFRGRWGGSIAAMLGAADSKAPAVSAPPPPPARQRKAPARAMVEAPPRNGQETGEGFMQQYYQASRLHFIGAYRAKVSTMVREGLVGTEADEAHRQEGAPGADPVVVAPAVPDEVDMEGDADEGVEGGAWEAGDAWSDANPAQGVAGLQQRPASVAARTIVHLDMDCFFASVMLLRYPQYADSPVVVAHAGTAGSKQEPIAAAQWLAGGFGMGGEISSANYVARRSGVRAGMWMRPAVSKCPDLVILPYDFRAIDAASRAAFGCIVRFGRGDFRVLSPSGTVLLDAPLQGTVRAVEAMSCDEAYLDITGTSDPAAFVTRLRQAVHAATGGCTASAGIARNKLLARLCTREAKPNGQAMLGADDGAVARFLAPMSVSIVPGIGWATVKRLKAERGVETVLQLQGTPLGLLQAWFGPKQGEAVYRAARGDDGDVPVAPVKQRKSVSAEVNWGLRFKSQGKLDTFIAELVAEAVHRLHRALIMDEGHATAPSGPSGSPAPGYVRVRGYASRNVTLKVMQRRAGEGESLKHLGHGICDTHSRSLTLPTPLVVRHMVSLPGGEEDDGGVGAASAMLLSAVSSMLRKLAVPVQDVRGLGIAIARLQSKHVRVRVHQAEQLSPAAPSDSPTRGDAAQATLPPAASGGAAESSAPASPPTAPASHARGDLSPSDVAPGLSQADPDVWAALPPDIRAEYTAQVARRRRNTGLLPVLLQARRLEGASTAPRQSPHATAGTDGSPGTPSPPPRTKRPRGAPSTDAVSAVTRKQRRLHLDDVEAERRKRRAAFWAQRQGQQQRQDCKSIPDSAIEVSSDSDTDTCLTTDAGSHTSPGASSSESESDGASVVTLESQPRPASPQAEGVQEGDVDPPAPDGFTDDVWACLDPRVKAQVLEALGSTAPPRPEPDASHAGQRKAMAPPPPRRAGKPRQTSMSVLRVSHRRGGAEGGAFTASQTAALADARVDLDVLHALPPPLKAQVLHDAKRTAKRRALGRQVSVHGAALAAAGVAGRHISDTGRAVALSGLPTKQSAAAQQERILAGIKRRAARAAAEAAAARTPVSMPPGTHPRYEGWYAAAAKGAALLQPRRVGRSTPPAVHAEGGEGASGLGGDLSLDDPDLLSRLRGLRATQAPAGPAEGVRIARALRGDHSAAAWQAGGLALMQLLAAGGVDGVAAAVQHLAVDTRGLPAHAAPVLSTVREALRVEQSRWDAELDVRTRGQHVRGREE